MKRSGQSYENRLLQLLEPRDLDGLRPHLEHVQFAYRQPLYEAYQDITQVYFPIEGVASLVSTMEDGSAAEIGTIGNEGVVGLPIILGDRRTPTNAYIQVPGSGLRLRADVLRREIVTNSRVRAVLLLYAHAFFNQVAQSAACAHFHSIQQRCCRWLLMTHDRVQSDQFMLTQEFLGMMLGVRRTSITEVAREMKRQKLITYSRGLVTILDRAGLEKHACECYAVSRNEFDHLLGLPVAARTSAGAAG